MQAEEGRKILPTDRKVQSFSKSACFEQNNVTEGRSRKQE
jgi:hypothetical protein